MLALEEPAGNPATAGPQGIRDSSEDTIGTGVTDGRETGTGEQDGQCAPLACGQTEDDEEE